MPITSVAALASKVIRVMLFSANCGHRVQRSDRGRQAEPGLDSRDGSDSHDLSRSSGQQLTIRAGGMPEPGMGEGGLHIRELGRRVSVAVEGKDTAGPMRQRCQCVVEVLSCGIAIDLDRDTALGRRRKNTLIPIRAITPARDPLIRPRGWARIRERPECATAVKHAIGLIVILAQPSMVRPTPRTKVSASSAVEIQLTGHIDVGFGFPATI